MNRRRFLAAARATLAAAAVSRILGVPRAADARLAPLGPDRIGLHLWSVRDALARDLDGTLAAIAAIGYADVELFSPYLSGARAPRDLRAALDRAGLAAVATHVGTGLLYRGWERHLEAARALGSRWVVCGSLAPEERRTVRDWHELAAVFTRAGEAARSVGLRFGYHVQGIELARLDGVRPYDLLLEETDPALVGFELDLAGVAASGTDPLGVLEGAPRRFFALHASDAGALHDASVRSGAPANDLTRILAHARAAGLAHVIVERDARVGERIEGARHSDQAAP